MVPAFKWWKIGTTAENLKAAAEGENYEWTSMYKEFAEVAREEGFTAIAFQMEKLLRSKKNMKNVI